MKKFYYLIEDIDIDGDNKNDGFIITKYKINKKTMDKIFLQTKYVSIKDFQKKVLDIRLKQDILKLKRNIKSIKKVKKGGFSLIPSHNAHYAQYPQKQNNEEQQLQNILHQLQELQHIQKLQEHNKDQQQIDPKILMHKLQNLELLLQQHKLQQFEQKNNLMQNYQTMSNNQYDNYMNNRNYMNNGYNNYPPHMIITTEKNSMMKNITDGFGLGVGFSIADNAVDMVFDMF
jgi:hypothetical protein